MYRWVQEVRDSNSEMVLSIVKVLEDLRPEAVAKFEQLQVSGDE